MSDEGSTTATSGGVGPKRTYYPSLVVNFKLRFDEALVASAPTYSTPAKAQPPLEDPQPPSAPVAVNDNLSQVMGVVPKQATVELPGYRQAGKFSLTFNFKDFPIDPRVIRAAQVELHLGAVTDVNFGKGMVQKASKEGGKRFSILDTRNGSAVRLDTLLMLGTIDSIDATHSTSGSEVHMEGRDLRGLLLDLPMTAGMLQKLALDKPIDDVVRQIIREHPLLALEMDTKKTFAVVVDQAEWSNGVLPVVDASVVQRINAGADGTKSTMAMKGNPDSGNFWDLITQFCFLVGAIPWFKGTELRISPAKSLYKQIAQGSMPSSGKTPFANGKKRTVSIVRNGQAQTEDLTIRRLVYGADILQFKLERKLTGKKVVQVVCVSTDSDAASVGIRNRTIEAEYPASPAPTDVSPDGSVGHLEVLRIPVPGIKDKSRLAEIAESIYHEIGRGEMGGSCSTKDLASFGGDNQDPDLLFMRTGDAIEVVTSAAGILGARPPIVSELTSHNSTSEAEEEKIITDRLGDATLAKVLVATARNRVQELQRVFRVKDVKFGWNASSGVSIDFDFHNFVEVRYDQSTTATKQPKGAGLPER